MTTSSPWLDKTHVGDCRHLLRQMHADGVQAQMCVTSPPYYGLRSYLSEDHPDKRLEIGYRQTPQQYIADLVETFRAVRDVLSDDGTLWIVIGDTYAAARGYQAPSTRGGPKHSAAQAGLGSSRVSNGVKPKDMLGIPWMLAFALRDDGWYLRQEVIWHKLNPMPESVTDRCTSAHEHMFLLSKRLRYFFDHVAIREPSTDARGPGNIRPVRQPPGERSSSTNANLRGSLHKIRATPLRNRRDVWSLSSQPFKGSHFAVFPQRLVTPCILAGSRPDDTVLDPFIGSGTTAVAALRLQRHFIGCELNRSFIDLQHLHPELPKQDFYDLGDFIMSTHFYGEGNIGSVPEFREFPGGNDEPRRLLRLNVYFDNPIPKRDGEYEDRGGFWAPVELWHRDAAHWMSLYQKGMRVLVEGRTVSDKWEDADDNPRTTFKIEARRVGILPFRVEAVQLSAQSGAGDQGADGA
jgi:site-specific DNA-methyltransferase (cytosine-N4-specific)